MQKRLVFLMGPPRCGTTWLQLALSQSPAVATTQETHLFSSYLKSLAWSWEAHAGDARGIGLRNLLGEAFFFERIRDFSDAVLDELAAGGADEAAIFLEKTPAHVEHCRLLARLYPDAHYLVIVRDPRAMVASMSRVGRTWGPWAASGIINNALRWQKDVDYALELETLVPNYKRVTYEAFAEDGQQCLDGIFRWAGLEHSTPDIDRFLQQVALPQLRAGAAAVAPWRLGDEPGGFFGSGQTDAWRRDLSGSATGLVETITATGMARLGYSLSRRRRRFSGRLAAYRISATLAAWLARVQDRL